ncbi:MAG: 7-carboxy-7-deazaguanine synthase QueE [Proteobacteria bacterium]|nr:7-carboxy-7-deazaguanine synthase QueE [Pseudomonadota bacterium]
MASADLCEVFTSIQGEGLFAGKKQVFTRFSGCNLSCNYCDTIYAKDYKGDALFESEPFSGFFIKERNPTPPFRLKEYIDLYYRLDPSIDSISLTGGEPLLYSEFITFFLGNYKGNKNFHLETNGTMPEKLKEVIELIDFISMDIKVNFLDSDNFFRIQREFLELSASKPLQIKIVVSGDLDLKNFDRALSLIFDVNKTIPLILQPSSKENFDIKFLSNLYKIAKNRITDVRILPQIHKFWGIK